MEFDTKTWFRKGLRDGLPISMGYFAVAFTLGIAARNAGMSVFQATLTSLLINASAGEFAGITLISEGASLLELAAMMLVVNARYLLMSCALSQKLDRKTPLWQRMLIGFDVTDELFGLSVSVPGKLCPFYTFGMMTISMPGWASGTALGVLLGNALPASVVSALSVGLYGMFLAVIIPPARSSRVIAGLVAASMGMSFLFARLPVLSRISSGMRIILLTFLLAGAAAVLFPVREEAADSDRKEETSHAV